LINLFQVFTKMLVLFESPSGYAIFKVLDESRLEEASDLSEHLKTPEAAAEMLQLTHFKKFEDTTEALAAATAAVEGKVAKPLKKVLKTIIAKDAHEKLAVADATLGKAIKEKLNLPCVYSAAVHELMRGIRAHVNSLITGLPERDMTAMALGLAHSLSRYKLKFSPDKVDTMIVQAISLLDDLDKELNNYAMRCREWYGWHFPEAGKIITDNMAYAKAIQAIGFKSKCGETDLSSILPEDVEEELKAAAEISMGTDISDEDIANVSYLCEQIIQISEYRMTLYDYLKNRMQAIAPNLTVLVGELVGARLIAHAGSLLNLAKHPASTVQILGSEKALFRALKTKHDTPKYGLIYHASMVGQTSTKSKGKIARTLAAKSSLAARYDALGDDVTNEMGIKHRASIETRIRYLEEGGMTKISGTGKSASKQQKYQPKTEDVSTYNTSMDTTIGKKRKAMEEESDEEKEEVNVKKVKVEKESEEATEETPKKKKKKKKSEATEDEEMAVDTSLVKEEDDEEKPKKKKKKKQSVDEPAEEAVVEEAVEEETPKKKKKKKKSEEVEAEAEEQPAAVESEKKKKKKKKSKTEDSDDE
jgi:nucleolar protein 58